MKTDKRRVGVIGHGFVGEAVAKGLAPVADVLVYDKNPAKGLFWVKTAIKGWAETLVEGVVDPFRLLVNECPIIFVCVPTPMKPDGVCDVSIVRDVVWSLANAEQIRSEIGEGYVSSSPVDWGSRMDWGSRVGQKPTIVIKSTVPPGTTVRLQEEFRWLNLVFNPEFLTEANYLEDFRYQERVILGGDDVEGVVTLFEEFGEERERMSRTSATRLWPASPGFPLPHIDVCTSTEAEVVKYLTNCFLAVKVSVANEFAGFCEKIGVDWNKVVGIAARDERLGETHWQVPGPDGHKGFGGTCFPKDINAAIHFMAMTGSMIPFTLNGAWETNLRVRPERDWEQSKGRAVSE